MRRCCAECGGPVCPKAKGPHCKRCYMRRRNPWRHRKGKRLPNGALKGQALRDYRLLRRKRFSRAEALEVLWRGFGRQA